MKQAAITGIRQAKTVEVPEPVPKDNWAKVKVLVAPLCTEYKGFLSGDAAHGYGHEAAGEVVEVAQSCRVKPGDRVVVQPGTACGRCAICLSGFFIHCPHSIDFETFTGSASGRDALAQYLLKPDWLLCPIPEDLPMDLASLAVCGLGPTFAACDAMNVGAFDSVLITGLGPAGLGGVVNAVFRGARVLAVEPNPYRARLAQELGAEIVLSPGDPQVTQKIMEWTEGRGVDVSFECSGDSAAFSLCGETARRLGQIALIGESEAPSLPLSVSKHMIRKGLRLHGVWHYPLPAFPRVLQVIRDSPVIGKMITHVFSLDEIQQAWETQAGGQCGKVLIRPWD